MRDYPALEVRQAGTASLIEEIGPIIDDFGPTAIEEAADDSHVRVFFGDDASRQLALTALRAERPEMAVRAIDVPDEDWAARSQAALKAARAGALTIAPPWDAPGGPGPDTIVILPSMGFGTGHHATTRLCLVALQRADATGKSVIDVGTGSGVLALAAARLGASRVAGIDNDQDAIDNALENRDLNGPDVRVEFRCASVEDAATDGRFDIVVANLTGAVLIRFAKELAALAADGGRLILSGMRDEEEADVLAAFGRPLLARESEDGWRCVVI